VGLSHHWQLVYKTDRIPAKKQRNLMISTLISTKT